MDNTISSGLTAVYKFFFAPVRIHFREPTRFGRKVVFMPTVRMFALFSSHPVVKELRSLVREARSGIEEDYG